MSQLTFFGKRPTLYQSRGNSCHHNAYLYLGLRNYSQNFAPFVFFLKILPIILPRNKSFLKKILPRKNIIPKTASSHLLFSMKNHRMANFKTRQYTACTKERCWLLFAPTGGLVFTLRFLHVANSEGSGHWSLSSRELVD